MLRRLGGPSARASSARRPFAQTRNRVLPPRSAGSRRRRGSGSDAPSVATVAALDPGVCTSTSSSPSSCSLSVEWTFACSAPRRGSGTTLDESARRLTRGAACRCCIAVGARRHRATGATDPLGRPAIQSVAEHRARSAWPGIRSRRRVLGRRPLDEYAFRLEARGCPDQGRRLPRPWWRRRLDAAHGRLVAGGGLRRRHGALRRRRAARLRAERRR